MTTPQSHKKTPPANRSAVLSDPYAEPTAIIIAVVVVVFAQGKKAATAIRRSKCQNKNKGHPATANAKRASRKKKMSSPDLDSVVQQQVHYIAGYNHSDWQPITLTLVEYPKGDLLGKLLAWISLAPLGIGAGFVALILFRRDLHTIVFFIGTLFNECVNMVLKHWIQEPRPMTRSQIWTEYGMPSSHSQFMCFFTQYVLLFIFIRLHHMNNNNARMERLVRLLVLFVCSVATFLVCYGRIYLQYHSLSQVMVGAVVGLIVGTVWFSLTHWFLTPLFPMVVSWKVSELFLLRDTTLIPNILWFEYTVTRQEARARARKLVSMKSQ